MLPNTKTLSANQPAMWDRHCLLVIPLSTSFRSEMRLSARFDGMKIGLRRNLGRFSPKRALGLFLRPSMFRIPFGFGPAAPTFGYQGAPASGSILPV